MQHVCNFGHSTISDNIIDLTAAIESESSKCMRVCHLTLTPMTYLLISLSITGHNDVWLIFTHCFSNAILNVCLFTEKHPTLEKEEFIRRIM